MATQLSDIVTMLHSKVQPGSHELQKIGKEIGKLYTDKGLPIDIAFGHLTGFSRDQKLSILDGACQWMIEHKRKSGATEKSIDRQRKSNRSMIDRFIKKGEVGVY